MNEKGEKQPTIEKEIILRNQIVTVVSSETKERMKVYFKLNQEYKECKKKCPVYDQASEKECEQICSKVYDKYPLELVDRYKDSPEKLDEQVSGVQVYKRRPREDRSGLWYRLTTLFKD